MEQIPDIPLIAGLLADSARAAMVWTLIDGSSRPAGELALAANISAQSASRHLGLLLEGGLLEVHAQGRYRFYRIANSEVACMIESMAALSAEIASSALTCDGISRPQPRAFKQARTCYDHFAGEFAVDLLDALLDAQWLEPAGREYRLTAKGQTGLIHLGVDIDMARQERRVFARPCTDISERRHHLSGALGAAILGACVAQGWVLRSQRSRVVNITPACWDAFAVAGLLPIHHPKN